jgi:hypothetical protein
VKTKIIAFLLAVFAVSFVVGLTGSKASAANCYYRCICSRPHKCCVVNGTEVCKPAPDGPIQCPQGYPC